MTEIHNITPHEVNTLLQNLCDNNLEEICEEIKGYTLSKDHLSMITVSLVKHWLHGRNRNKLNSFHCHKSLSTLNLMKAAKILKIELTFCQVITVTVYCF